MGKSIGFKQYQRGTRVQTVEETFNKGMSYTNAPLDEGYSRVLLNLDINSDGGLQPRPGFVKDGLTMELLDKAYDLVVSSAPIADNEGNTWTHTILGSTTDSSGLYQIVQDETGVIVDGKLEPTEALGDPGTLNTKDASGVAYFNKKAPHIHRMPLTDTEHPVKSVVGCRAYNNDFYYIQDNNICHAGCLLTKDATDTEPAEYEFTSQYVAPKECTPAGATTVGFNILSETPYSFANKYNSAADNLVATGLVAYTDAECTKPATVIKAGQEVWLRCFVEHPQASVLYTDPNGSTDFFKINPWFCSTVTNLSTRQDTVFYFTTANIEFVFEYLKDTQYSALGVTTTRPSEPTAKPTMYILNHNPQSKIHQTAAYNAITLGTSPKHNKTVEIGGVAYQVYTAPNDAVAGTVGYIASVATLKIIAPEDNPTFRCTIYTHSGQTNYTTNEHPLAHHLSNLYNSLDCPEGLYASSIVAPYKNTEQLRANMELKNYNLMSATGMAYWHERLVLWGIPEQANAIFFSDLRDPSYFPYPANTHYFNDTIIAAVPLLDNLVVFTETEVHIMTDVTTTSTATITAQCIQRNLHIDPWDRHLIQPVKNMVFFKSGNYYYMIVPKANSMTGELTVATVYKPLTNFFDDFKNTIYNLLKKVYNYKEELKLVHYYNYLDFEDIVNTYVFEAERHYVNFMVIYNSMSRAWSLRVVETPGLIQPIKLDATQRGVYGVVDRGVFTEMRYIPDTLKDSYGYYVQNHQYYDSGYREHEANLKKRYREYQLIVNNTGQCDQEFHTGFYVDQAQREQLFDYVVTPVHTVSSEGYPIQEYIVDPVPVTTYKIPGTTRLTTNSGSFKIGYSMFPEVTNFKLRFHTSGKGYAPRMVIYTKDFKKYELQSCSYVYRLLYSR